MEIKASQLLPLVLDFAEKFLAEEDFEVFKCQFKSEVDYKSDVLVKSGGLQTMLGCYLKHNKSVFKKFKSSLGGDSKKRPRASSNVSNGSSTKQKSEKKRDKKSSKKKDATESRKSSGVMTRRKSSVDWQPKTEAEILAEAG